MTELSDLAAPVVRTRASLHRHDAARLRPHEIQHLVPAQLPSERNRPVCPCAVELKTALRQVDPDDGSVFHWMPPPPGALCHGTSTLVHCDAVRRRRPPHRSSAERSCEIGLLISPLIRFEALVRERGRAPGTARLNPWIRVAVPVEAHEGRLGAPRAPRPGSAGSATERASMAPRCRRRSQRGTAGSSARAARASGSLGVLTATATEARACPWSVVSGYLGIDPGVQAVQDPRRLPASRDTPCGAPPAPRSSRGRRRRSR